MTKRGGVIRGHAPHRVGRRFRIAALLVAALCLAACTGRTDQAGDGSAAPASQPRPNNSPVGLPRPDRPSVALTFDTTSWRAGHVTGIETVAFTPDKKVCEVDFRLWPNKPTMANSGDHLTLTSASIDHAAVKPMLVADGGTAAAPTLAQLPLKSCAKAGTTVNINLAFDLTLGVDVAERVGRSHDGSFAWFDSGFPLLAWEYGYGWMRDPAEAIYGEMAGSEDFNLTSLAVTASSSDNVAGTGAVQPAQPGSNSTVTHVFSAPAVRNVAIAVGNFTITDTTIGDTKVHVAVPPNTAVTTATWTSTASKSLTSLEDLLGPFPYTDLWIDVLEPSLGGGIEFPGGAFFADIDPADATTFVPHEIAHSYFYGLVGNDQGRDPWLDETWANWASIIVTGNDANLPTPTPPGNGPLGASMAYWASQPSAGETYFDVVYGLGALALQHAYNSVGAEAFGAALRAYLHEEAHRIARPDDVKRAFAALPDVLRALTDVGAFTTPAPLSPS